MRHTSAPAAVSSEARIMYWCRPSSYSVLNGVTPLGEEVAVPEPI